MLSPLKRRQRHFRHLFIFAFNSVCSLPGKQASPARHHIHFPAGPEQLPAERQCCIGNIRFLQGQKLGQIMLTDELIHLQFILIQCPDIKDLPGRNNGMVCRNLFVIPDT